jgi:8-oxo-dGTP diphosphatase
MPNTAPEQSSGSTQPAAGTRPGAAGSTPIVAGTTHDASGSTPVVAGTTPGATGSTPVVAGTTPGATGSTPIVASTPHAAGAIAVVSGAVHVVVGVIRNTEGKVLLAKRRNDAHQGGLWEFPGGKVEAGESVQHALRRELKEELAIDLTHSQPLIQIHHQYSDKTVFLDVWEVDSYSGTPTGNEGQVLVWVEADQLQSGNKCPYPLPAANAAIIKALHLPDALLITGEFEGEVDFLARLERALERGVRLVQFRPSRSTEALHKTKKRSLLKKACGLCGQYNARLVVHAAAHHSTGVDSLTTTDGVDLHLPAKQLMACHSRPVATGRLFGASCHNLEELQRAAELDADYALLSPVKPTASHPDTAPLGWDHFQSLVHTINIPVYALGGLNSADIPHARIMGAQGIAAISALWGV